MPFYFMLVHSLFIIVPKCVCERGVAFVSVCVCVCERERGVHVCVCV